MEPIGKDGWTGPDSALEETSVCFLQEDVSLDTIVICIIVLRCNSYGFFSFARISDTRSVHTWIYHDDIVLIVTMQIADKIPHLFKWKFIAKREYLECIHVVDVCPHGL